MEEIKINNPATTGYPNERKESDEENQDDKSTITVYPFEKKESDGKPSNVQHPKICISNKFSTDLRKCSTDFKTK